MGKRSSLTLFQALNGTWKKRANTEIFGIRQRNLVVRIRYLGMRHI
jgi:hypothetical protein